MDEDEFAEPAAATNFLERYRHARAAAAAPKSPRTTARTRTPEGPPSPSVASRSGKSKSIWGSVFHPLGKAPTKADRYDLGSKPSPPGSGNSVSELHAKGVADISLDQKGED